MKERVENASGLLNITGHCKAEVLGAEFCKAHKFKLESMRFDHGIYENKEGPKIKFDSRGFVHSDVELPEFMPKPGTRTPPRLDFGN